MATRPTQSVVPITGTVGTYHAASGGGDKVSPDAGTILHVVNLSGGSINLTIATPGTKKGRTVADDIIPIADGAVGKFIPMDTDYRNPSDGLASLSWSGTTTVTFAVIRA